MPGDEWLFATANADCEDPPGVASYEEQVQASRAAYQREFAVGRRDWPLFVPDWPSGKDPRFYDRGNPLYNPLAERGSDWRSEVSEQEYTRFYVFVKMKYGKTRECCKTNITSLLLYVITLVTFSIRCL